MSASESFSDITRRPPRSQNDPNRTSSDIVVHPFQWADYAHLGALELIGAQDKPKKDPTDAIVSTSPAFERGGPIVTQNSPSLYERLGGVYSIATVVEDFIDHIMIDPRLNANPRVDEAHHRVSPAGFRYLVTEMVCWAAGGPQNYTGRSMKETHKDLMITALEWEAFLDDLQQTLDKFAVPQAEQAEIKAIIDSTRADIVV